MRQGLFDRNVGLWLIGHGNGTVCDALGQILQQFCKAVKPIILLAEEIHVLAATRIQQLLERPHVIVQGYQQRLITPTAGDDLIHMSVDRDGEMGLLLAECHAVSSS